MKKLSLLLLSFILSLGIHAQNLNQHSISSVNLKSQSSNSLAKASVHTGGSANAITTATIITPINITKVSDLSFGNIVVSDNGGTVQLLLTGDRMQTGGITLPAISGPVSNAAFTVTGDARLSYRITLPKTVIISNGDEEMVVEDFVHNAACTLNSGSESFLVGAVLNVNSRQTAGLYSSAEAFSVTVNYD